ncbi:MAG: threonine synthase [Deltaproteobacteria bacterium]|nr:MAG: threonine synthase [Deltaproteobacteria bacterium]
MKINQLPEYIQNDVIPVATGNMVYRCLGCGGEFSIDDLLYVCPECAQVLMLHDTDFERLSEIPGPMWRDIFDYRKLLNIPSLNGIYRYHELIGPVIPLEDIVYLGEGHTPVIEANAYMKKITGLRFFFKNDGQNPSASFKDRGMASALSYIHHLVNAGRVKNILAVCASTGDTSAAAALYSAYLQPNIKSAVLLPHKKVTPQQLSQPLGNGARVFEIPGVFDDCMKVVESLSDHYDVALLNSKNAWRILGQESFSYEIAQAFDYDLANTAVVVPVGNAGNITAVMNGFLKFFNLGIIDTLPKVIGVQSTHANPVYEYYHQEPVNHKRCFKPQSVKPSVAQAAMIGNPVSMPRVIQLVDAYNTAADKASVFFTTVSEQSIMDWELKANRNGHIACTQGGEALAGMIEAKHAGYLSEADRVVLDSTAHALKFSGFQDMYFENRFSDAYRVYPDPELQNKPELIKPAGIDAFPEPGAPLTGDAFDLFVKHTSEEIASKLMLSRKK